VKRCFSCGTSAGIVRSGYRKDGTPWHVCADCRSAWLAERELDRQALEAANSVRVGERGVAVMGWNGTPSDRSLRRRSRH